MSGVPANPMKTNVQVLNGKVNNESTVPLSIITAKYFLLPLCYRSYDLALSRLQPRFDARSVKTHLCPNYAGYPKSLEQV